MAKEWKKEIRQAATICAPYSCAVEPSTHAYEIATIKGEGVSLLLYPHKTQGTGNYSIRARDNGSKNKEKACEVLNALFCGVGLPRDEQIGVRISNQFWCKTMPLPGFRYRDECYSGDPSPADGFRA